MATKKTDDQKTITEFINSTRREGDKASENFAYLVERLVGSPAIKQLQFNNGCYVSSILEFMGDNPGLVEAMVGWVQENYESEIQEDDAEEEGEEQEEEENE